MKLENFSYIYNSTEKKSLSGVRMFVMWLWLYRENQSEKLEFVRAWVNVYRKHRSDKGLRWVFSDGSWLNYLKFEMFMTYDAFTQIVWWPY